ncbi:MAG: hypothetical protein KJ018_22265 [Burkholderiales bacterium]|nr:hypothetical protein [Burkholderiales bacterium]
MVTSMRALVAAHADRWAAAHASTIIEWCGGHFRVSSDDPTILRRQRPRLWRPPGHLDFGDVVGLFPDLVAARLEAVIRDHPYAAGASLDERPAALATADAALTTAETAHTALVDEAARYGVTLPLLDVVRQRRETERTRRQMAAAAATRRAELERAVEQAATAAAAPRAVRSGYIASDGATMATRREV